VKTYWEQAPVPSPLMGEGQDRENLNAGQANENAGPVGMVWTTCAFTQRQRTAGAWPIPLCGVLKGTASS
jgi:hypothetical protein